MSESTARPPARRRRRRLWALAGAIVLTAALVAYLVLAASGCLVPALHVTIAIRNTGAQPLRGLSIDQVDGAGHAIIPTVPAGKTVSVTVNNDEHFGPSHLDLVDDMTGRNYALPPHVFDGSLHGTIDVEVARPAGAGELKGRARYSTDGADPAGWESLRVD